MKYVTATEARKNWFKLLDEAANGESISISRNGKTLVLRLDGRKRKEKIPDYSKVIQVPDVENADKWGWEWTERRGLVPITKR